MIQTVTAEPLTRRVSAGDIELQVTSVGHGPALVWLHGSGPGASGMSNFSANLDAFGDRQNLVIDLPRYGGSDRPTIREPLIPYAGTRVLAALDTLGVEQASLIGNSFGGGVAAWIAATAPERVASLVLMAPGGVQPADLKIPDDLPAGLKLLGAYMAQAPDLERMRAFITAMFADASLATDELVQRRFAASDREPEIDVSAGRPEMGDLRGLLADITAPTLLIWGREDRFVPIDWSLDWVRGVADSELHILANCGHWVQYEQLDAFNRAAGDHVRGI